MNFSNELLFFFSALGVFNAILISFYFFFIKKPRNISNFFFGLLLFMLAVRVAKSVVFYFNHDLANFFIKVGLGACILIGPSLYFYVLSVVKPEKINQRWVLHFIAILAVTIGVGVYFPDTFNPYYGSISWIQIIYLIWLGYMVAAGYVLRHNFAKIFKANTKLNGLDFWLLSVFMGCLIIWIAYRTSSFTSYIVGALSFSFIFYILMLLLFFSRKKKAIFNPKEKYANKKIDALEAEEMLAALNIVMTTEKLYTNSNLKLKDVSAKMNQLPHTVSQLLNDNLDKNFTQYVNEYRISEAKKRILSDHQLTLEAIGYDCGFNSKSTFYSVFKKIVGTTPSQYKAAASSTDL